MLKQLSLISLFSLITFPAFAQFDSLPVLTVKDKNQDIVLFIDLEVGHMPYGSTFDMRKDNEKTDCSIVINNPDFVGKPDEGDWSFKEHVKSYEDYQVHTISKNDNSYKIIFELQLHETLNLEPAKQVTKGCSVANDVITTTTIHWAGDIEFGKPVHIKMPKDNELVLELKEKLSEEDNAL